MDEFDINIYRYLGGSLENAVNAFVDPAVTRIIEDIGPMVLSGVYLYVAVALCRIVLGLSARPVGDVLVLVVRIAIVSTLALSANVYQGNIVAFFESIEAGLLSVFQGSIPGTDASAGVYAALDASLSRGMDLTSECFDRARDTGWRSSEKYGWIASAIVLFVAAIATTIAGAAIAMLAKLAIALLIVVGPLFLACLMFPVLGRFFELWAAQAFQYVLVGVVVLVLLAITIALHEGYVGDIDIGAGELHPIGTACAVAILAVICFLALRQAPTLAAGLGGGLALAGATARDVFAPAGSALRGASSFLSFGNPKLMRRDMRSGHMVRMSAWRHLAAGNTRLNPAFRSYMAERSRIGWGPAPGGRASRD